MFDLVLKNGNLFANDDFKQMDLAVNGKKIAAIGKNLAGKSEIDVAGMWVLPGAIDAHTHFSLPFANAVSADDFYTGTKAAAIGGVTTIIDFLAQQSDEGILESLKRRRQLADGQAVVDYSFHACITNYSEKVAGQMPEIAKAGLTSLKIFMAYASKGMMQKDMQLLNIMRDCQKLGIMLSVHAETGLLIDDLCARTFAAGHTDITALPVTRPLITEIEAIQRLALYAAETGCFTYVVHTSSGSGAEIIRRARRQKAPIIGETCPQYLYLDDSSFNEPDGHLFSCCPPIRDKKEQNMLFKNLASGDLAVVATDHCPFTRKNKDAGKDNIASLPMGLPGIETLPAMVLSAALNNLLPLRQAVKCISENPAKLFGLYPEKGSLLPGTAADIMVFNPKTRWQIDNEQLHMATDYSPYQGLELTGQNELTIFAGEPVYTKSGGWQGKKGGGVFLKRNKADPQFFT
jgi:dihydropyrimidinase